MAPQLDPYYLNTRAEIVALLPASAGRILEIGCAGGHTLAHVGALLAADWLGGVELFADAAEQARGRLDEVWVGDVEALELPLPPSSLDLILCLDVLEHLRDPWKVVARLGDLLAPGGSLVTSIPNVRHFEVLAPLVFRGEFRYRDEGLLDRTHLRFFTRSGAVALVASGGLGVDRVIGRFRGEKSRRLNALTFGLASGFLEYQYLLRATKRAEPRLGSIEARLPGV